MFNSNVFDPHHPMLDMSPPNNSSGSGQVRRREEDDIDAKSGGTGMETIDVPFTDEQQDSNQRPRKKGYHRHTMHQIHQMELFYKHCPHPDDKQRKELGRELGLAPLQIKFWFQNKRTQMKAQSERQENAHLKAENEKLRAENMRYKEAFIMATCTTCGGPASLGEMSYDEQLMKLENARLREEIERISGIVAKYAGKSTTSYSNLLSPNNNQMPSSSRAFDLGIGNYGGDGSDLLRSSLPPILADIDKPIIVEVAVAAMEELVRLARAGHPLWVLSNNHNAETLNEEEYLRVFPRGTGSKPFGVRSESSRDSAIIMMNPASLVDMLMNMNQWASFFCHIVSKASTLEVLSTGVAGNYNGALQVIQAEFQLPTPLVSTRENYLVRYSKQHPDGIWAVVDVSLDNLRPSTISRNRRRPSGCVIQPLPGGYSKITWVEHVEVDDRAVHSIYRPLVMSGLPFGAKRWAATLDRQCERLASSMASIIPAGDICPVTDADGRKSILNLAEKMVKGYCTGVGASSTHTWSTLLGSNDIRVMTRNGVDEPGRDPSLVLSAATSLWLPVPPKRVFDFLRDANSRSQWDILSNGGLAEELVHIANGRNPGNYVSILRNNNAETSNMVILQESCTDSTGSYVIYAPVDVSAMNLVLSGGDPTYVSLLPSGFAILPDGPPRLNDGGLILEIGGGGTLLTVAFQILVDSAPDAKLTIASVATVRDLIKCTIERISSAVMGQNQIP